jgi:hypothetical protein
MPKELRISAVVEVPDDIWAQTDKLSTAKPVVEAFTEAMTKMGGKVDVELVAPRPRGADKGDPAAQYAALGGKLPA